MAVAKSYQSYKITCDPYTKNGRKYVTVETSHGLKEVRWYTDEQYKKYYGEAPSKKTDPYYKSQKELLGFKEGYINIFYGDGTFAVKDWLRDLGAVYRRDWGWGLPGGAALPEQLPDGVKVAKLDWSLVGNDDEKLKSDAEVEAAVESIIYPTIEGVSFGEVGKRYEINVTIDKVIDVDSYYGVNHMHFMHDDDNHIFMWSTQSKRWEPGQQKRIKGTVKGTKIYKGRFENILSRCAEI